MPSPKPSPTALPADRRAVIQVSDLHKTFRLPRNQISTFKERVLHPLTRVEYDELRVLRGIGFQVADGEFFGIVGRNGSGKSTLLKCLAGIYRHDAGQIHVAGQLAPFIELGVGFNPDLPALENVLLNAVMMGMSQREARERFEEIIAFAELEDFLELKLKNYSSGMQVRLAFSAMIQADADVLLIDEVLAVGDASFQQKCLDVFYRLRDEGKTIILVTHDMGTVERFCHRALLLKNGLIDLIGDPHEVGQAYLEENFARRPHEGGEGEAGARGSITEVWVTGELGTPVEAIAHGTQLHMHATVEAHETIDRPQVTLWIENEEGTRIFVTTTEDLDATGPPLIAGEIAHMRVDLEVSLAAGHYYVGCLLSRGPDGMEPIAYAERGAGFVVYGTDRVFGLVTFRHDIVIERTHDKMSR